MIRYKTSKVRVVASRTENAASAIGRLESGDHISGLTAGQFSMIDILEHMLNEAGPSDVLVSTWTSGIYDVCRAKALADTGLIRSIRFLVDRSIFTRTPKYSGPMIEAFGVDSFRHTNVHAKVAVVRSETKLIVCRSSMNLNKNLRSENLDISVDGEVAEFYSDVMNDMWQSALPDRDADEIFSTVFDRYQKTKPVSLATQITGTPVSAVRAALKGAT